MMTPTALYARASTRDQVNSVSQQIAAAEEYAPRHGLKIVTRYIDDGVSGIRFETRPAVRQLLRDVEHKPQFSVLLVYDESRFGRIAPREAIYWKYHLARHGVKVRLIHTRATVGDDFASFVLEGLEMGESREYSLKLSRSTLRGQKANALAGFHTGGCAPYGYKRVAIDPASGRFIRDLPGGLRRRLKEEKVVLGLGDQREVDIVRRIYQMRVDGLGHRAIASVLTKDGIPTPRWPRARAVSTRWSWMTVKTIIENPVYQGAKTFNRRSQSRLSGGGRVVRENQPDAWIQTENVPAIVSKTIWKQANTIERRHCPPRNKHSLGSSFLLSNLMVCRCASRFHGITKTSTGKRYYIEAGVHNGSSKCRRLLISQEEVEQLVTKAVTAYVQSGPFARHVRGHAPWKPVTDLVHAFRSIKQRPLYVQKTILRQFVHRVVVDPRLKRVTILVRRIPKVDQADTTRSPVPVKRITLNLNGARDRHVLAED